MEDGLPARGWRWSLFTRSLWWLYITWLGVVGAILSWVTIHIWRDIKKEPGCPTVETEKLLRNLTKRVPRRKCNYCIFRDVWIERSDALIDSKDTKQGQGNAADSRLTFLLLFKPQWEALVIENLLCVVHYIVSDFSAECFRASVVLYRLIHVDFVSGRWVKFRKRAIQKGSGGGSPSETTKLYLLIGI